MKKPILVVMGRSDSGKSSVIKHLILRLLPPSDARRAESRYSEAGWYTPQGNCRDVNSIIVEYRGKRIGVTTLGDGKAKLREVISELDRCDCIICAAHPTADMEEYLLSWTEKWRLSIVYKIRSLTSDRDALRREDEAFSEERVLSELDRLIDEEETV